MLRAEGEGVLEWFETRGWKARPLSAMTPTLFVDEAVILDVRVRRVWHTPLAVVPAPRRGDTPRDTVVLQAEGTTRWSWTDAVMPIVAGENDALAYPGRSRPEVVADTPGGRLEIETAALPLSEPTRLLGAEDGPLWRVLASTVNALFNNDPARVPSTSQVPLRNAVEQLCVALAASVAPVESVTGAGHATWSAAMQVILEEAARPEFSVDELAERVHVSRQYLARVFARRGTTPREAIVARREQLADALLAVGASPIDAAVRAGFGSARALSSARRRRAAGSGQPSLDEPARRHTRSRENGSS